MEGEGKETCGDETETESMEGKKGESYSVHGSRLEQTCHPFSLEQLAQASELLDATLPAEEERGSPARLTSNSSPPAPVHPRPDLPP